MTGRVSPAKARRAGSAPAGHNAGVGTSPVRPVAPPGTGPGARQAPYDWVARRYLLEGGPVGADLAEGDGVAGESSHHSF